MHNNKYTPQAKQTESGSPPSSPTVVHPHPFRLGHRATTKQLSTFCNRYQISTRLRKYPWEVCASFENFADSRALVQSLAQSSRAPVRRGLCRLLDGRAKTDKTARSLHFHFFSSPHPLPSPPSPSIRAARVPFSCSLIGSGV